LAICIYFKSCKFKSLVSNFEFQVSSFELYIQKIEKKDPEEGFRKQFRD